jgi:hypothetical protein
MKGSKLFWLLRPRRTDKNPRRIAPRNGVVEVRFQGFPHSEGKAARHGEAFVQAFEIRENLRGLGAVPISSSLKP